jgi:hypothetical protein
VGAITWDVEEVYVGCSEGNITTMLSVLATVEWSESMVFGASEWSKIRADLTTQEVALMLIILGSALLRTIALNS